MDIKLMGNTLLRLAIRENLVSFPSSVPALMRSHDGDTLERVVQLYFVRGWSVRDICGRYRLSKAMVQKLLSEWRMRAVAAGYIQAIHPEPLEEMARAQAERSLLSSLQTEAGDDLAEGVVFDPGTPIWAPARPSQSEPVLSATGGM